MTAGAREGPVNAQKPLFDDVELNPVEKSVVADRPGVSSSPTEGFEVGFAGETHVGLVDGGERDEFDRVDLDLTVRDAIAATGLHLGPLPQPERDGDPSGQHLFT